MPRPHGAHTPAQTAILQSLARWGPSTREQLRGRLGTRNGAFCLAMRMLMRHGRVREIDGVVERREEQG